MSEAGNRPTPAMPKLVCTTYRTRKPIKGSPFLAYQALALATTALVHPLDIEYYFPPAPGNTYAT